MNTAIKNFKKLKKKVHNHDKKEIKRSHPIDSCILKAKKPEEKDFVLDQVDIPQPEDTRTQMITNDDTDVKILRKLIKKTPIKPNVPTFSKKVSCYVCKSRFHELHHFYDQLCPKCGDFNFQKRSQECDFTGRIALVTGGRVKIGYQITLYLLRHNCTVVVTSRFNKDCFTRFAQESDFDSFKDCLTIYPLDLRDLSGIMKFVEHLNNKLPKLDILINNAAQTVRRDAIYYQHLLDVESKSLDSFNNPAIYQCLPQDFGILNSTSHSMMFQLPNRSESLTLQIQPDKVSSLGASVLQSQFPVLGSDLNPNLSNFPKDVLDINAQQVDLSTNTSWNKQLNDVDIFEFAETQVINCWAPFILCSKLKPLMSHGENQNKFIINVASMEGKFDYQNKTSRHPHTNMSKAALNMLTRTCGSSLAESGIYMNSVDTGWVSEMIQNKLFKKDRTVPLDEIDGAMRVLDPIIIGINEGKLMHSLFLKDYTPTTW